MPRAVSIPATELPPGQRRLVFVEGRSLVLFNIDGTVYAIDNTCPHQGASLAGGKLEGTWLQCPAHGLHFDLAASDTAALCLKHFPVSTADGMLTVRLEDSPHTT
ncbi:Rieske (2Fe-2S) protein [Ralstonia insidiosa]|uniref:Rieske (2Fe-2S) protein n=1 Tax=Ralstonia insidiosa TaxID=190721 RepID=A0A848NT15_9RALS|nr:Rieske (2Fe-2S) protein [Ralstonia insidiosa]NMV36400.1 Rieske (2Fe-2S) protein [Ralstonia insidiosa]